MQPDPSLKAYLSYSAATHAGILLLLLFKPAFQSAPSAVYRVDFIGSTQIANRDPESEPGGSRGPARAADRPSPMSKADAFGRRRHAPLPRPSFLDDPASEPPEKKKETASAAGAGGAPGASVSSDLPNFPYPWYISQLRQSLWDRWSKHMPVLTGEVVVMFSVLRNGSVTDIRVESSSGEGSFDEAGLAAVRDAAPFAPLPKGFPESFLKIHVRFTSQ